MWALHHDMICIERDMHTQMHAEINSRHASRTHTHTHTHIHNTHTHIHNIHTHMHISYTCTHTHTNTCRVGYVTYDMWLTCVYKSISRYTEVLDILPIYHQGGLDAAPWSSAGQGPSVGQCEIRDFGGGLHPSRYHHCCILRVRA